MKKLVFILLCVISCSVMNTNAEVVQQGTTFTQVKSTRSSNAKQTSCTYIYNDVSYPIFINPKSGRCYIEVVSKKTGKPYKKYLDEATCRAVCTIEGVTYVEKQTTK